MGERIDVLGNAVPAYAGRGDGGSADDEDRGGYTAISKALVECGEKVGELLACEVMPSRARHAVTKSRSGT